MTNRTASIALLAMLFVPSARTEAETGKSMLVVGRVSMNPKKHAPELQAMASYAASQLSEFGIERGEVLLAPNNEVMIEHLRAGRIDWVTESTFSAVAFQTQSGAVPILRRWTEGASGRRAVLVARVGGEVTRLSDLLGRVVAFEDPGSSTGYFLPAAAILDHGFALKKLASIREKPPAKAVGYVFARDEINISTWVSKGLVDAGALSDADLEDPTNVPVALRPKLKTIYQGSLMPAAFELVRSDLDGALRSALRQVLLDAHRNPDGRDALRQFRDTERFTELDDESIAALKEAKRIRADLSPRLGEPSR